MQWSKSKRNFIELAGTAVAAPVLIVLLFFVGAPRTVFYPTLLLGQPIIAATGMGAVAVDGVLAFIDTWIVLLIVVKLFGIFIIRKREQA
jgi:hypothetical protein